MSKNILKNKKYTQVFEHLNYFNNISFEHLLSFGIRNYYVNTFIINYYYICSIRKYHNTTFLEYLD